MSAFSWEPLDLDVAVDLMIGFPAPWWIAGGWAIDLFAERVTREHSDVDFVVLRANQLLIRDALPGWDVQVAHDGRLEPWTEPLAPPRGGLWARSAADGPWQVQFLLAEHDGDVWVFRHDATLRMPLSDIVLRNRDGIPYLRPELVLLNKARRPRERDELDFETTLPLLNGNARAWLHDRLPREHPWRRRL